MNGLKFWGILARLLFWGPKDGAFGKPCLCPTQKEGVFDENGENDEFALNLTSKTGVLLLEPPVKRRK